MKWSLYLWWKVTTVFWKRKFNAIKFICLLILLASSTKFCVGHKVFSIVILCGWYKYARNNTLDECFWNLTQLTSVYFDLIFCCFCKHEHSPVATEGFGGLSPPNWNIIINQWSFVNFWNIKPPCTNVKPPYWKRSGDSSA